MNKRATIMLLMTGLGLLLAIVAFFVISIKSGEIGSFIGAAQMDVLLHAKRADEAQFYLEQSSFLAAQKSIKSVADFGSGCGSYVGYRVWSNETQECYPDKNDMKKKFVDSYMGNLNKYLSNYPDISFPKNNYDFSVYELKAAKPKTEEKATEQKPLAQKQNETKTELKLESSFVWPTTNPIVTSCYGPRDIINGSKNHKGLDLRAYINTPIRAIDKGEVIKVFTGCTPVDPNDKKAIEAQFECGGKYGNHVIIKSKSSDNKDLYSIYAHLNAVDEEIVERKSINQGQLIGLSGTTGTSPAPHLHFGLGYSPTNFDLDPLCYFPALSSNQFKPGSCNNKPNPYAFCPVSMQNIIFSYQTATKDTLKIIGISKEKTKIIRDFSIRWARVDYHLPLIYSEASRSGEYDFDANIKTEIGYLFDEFDELKIALKPLSEKITQNCLKSGTDYTACTSSIFAQQKDFTWRTSCGNENEKAAEDFIESMILCSQMKQSGFCKYKVPSINEDTNIEILKDVPAKTIISSVYINETLNQFSPYFVSSSSDEWTPVLMNCNKISAVLKSGKIELSGKECIGDAKYTSASYEDELILYNSLNSGSKANTLSFVDEATFNKFKDKVITLNAVKKEIRLCARSKKYSLFDEKGVSTPVTYKIAVVAGDPSPPEKVSNVIISNTAKSEENITIKFNPNIEPDMSQYNIYYSESDITDLDNKEKVKLAAIIKHDANIKLPTQYVTTIKVPKDETSYFFAVTAVDISGNEGKFNVYQGKSKDELKPGSVEKLEFTKIQNVPPKIDITITPPAKNEDGSELKDLSKYSLYMQTTNADSCSITDIKAILTSEPISNLNIDKTGSTHYIKSLDLTTIKLASKPGTKYCAVVIAEDENIDLTKEVNQERYSDKSILFIKI